MSIIAAAVIDGEGSIAVSRVYIPGFLSPMTSHWNTLHRHLTDASLSRSSMASGSLEIEGLTCLYRRLMHGYYLAILCRQYCSLAEASDAAEVLVELLNGLGPLSSRDSLFDAIFALDETVQLGYIDKPISPALVRDRLEMHSEAEEAAIEERKAKEAEAERVRRKREVELAAQRDVESGIGTGALGLFNKARGWLGFGEPKQEKKWGHGIPEAELERLRQKNNKGTVPLAKTADSSDSSNDSSSSDNDDVAWNSTKTREKPGVTAADTGYTHAANAPDSSSESSDASASQPVKRPVGRGITFGKK